MRNILTCFNMFYTLNASGITWRKLNLILGKQSAASVINRFRVNGQEIIGSELANTFYDYFINLVDNSESRVCEALTHVSRYVSQSIFFYPTDVDEITSVFYILSNGKSRDIDDIQIKPVKYVITLVAPW